MPKLKVITLSLQVVTRPGQVETAAEEAISAIEDLLEYADFEHSHSACISPDYTVIESDEDDEEAEEEAGEAPGDEADDDREDL